MWRRSTTERSDGDQFQGWCHFHAVCEGEVCTTYCTDSWYEWNSCTSSVEEFRPPHPGFYNYANNTEEITKFPSTGNVHGNGAISVVVSCPTDTNGDYYADSGGCRDLLATGFSVSGHAMELWELDHGVVDDQIGWLTFPTLAATVDSSDCTVYSCSGGSDGTYRSKISYNSISTVSANAAIQIRSAEFSDAFGNCCDPLSNPGCQQ